MDLQAIRENLRQNKYQSRAEFLGDVDQIVDNCSLYNGEKSSLTSAAQRMLQKCGERLGEKEDRLIRLEKAINPLLDDNDQVALSFIFENLINGRLKTMSESYPFLKPVNKKQVKDYYTVIRKPMDLETITKKVATQKYHTRDEFLADIELIANNCEQYNGTESTFTKQARTLVEYSKTALNEFREHCEQLEKNIASVQDRVKREAEMEDTWGDDETDERQVMLFVHNSLCILIFINLISLRFRRVEPAHQTMNSSMSSPPIDHIRPHRIYHRNKDRPQCPPHPRSNAIVVDHASNVQKIILKMVRQFHDSIQSW